MKKTGWAKAQVVITLNEERDSSYRYGGLTVRRVSYQDGTYTSWEVLISVTFQANSLLERSDFMLHEVQRLQGLPSEWFARMDTSARPFGGFYGTRLRGMSWNDLQRAADAHKDLTAASNKVLVTGCALWDMVQACIVCGAKDIVWPDLEVTGAVRKWLGSSYVLELIARDADRRAKEAKEREEYQAARAAAQEE